MDIRKSLALLSVPLLLLSCATTPRDTAGGPPNPPVSEAVTRVTALTLLDAASDAPLGPSGTLSDGMTLDLAGLATVNLDLSVETQGAAPVAVEFVVDGHRHLDEGAPFTLAPDRPMHVLGWTPAAGQHTVTATPYVMRGGVRVAGTPLTVRFEVTNADVKRHKYVAVGGTTTQPGKIMVYDMDRNHALVRSIDVPGLIMPRGIAASGVTDRLYVPHWGDRNEAKYEGQPRFGYLTCIDLKTDRVLWTRRYNPSIDSLAITPDGSKLYMPSGEEAAEDGSGFWFVLDGRTGEEMPRIPVHVGAHNTVMGLSGRHVYLASLMFNKLSVADTSTDRVIRQVGPFSNNIRPFTVNHDESLAFVTVDNKSGFEIGDLRTGKVLYSVDVQGYPWTDPRNPNDPHDRTTQTHGIALTPDEREIWIVDHSNYRLHIFDVSGVPQRAPVQVASIDVREEDPNHRPKWLNFSRDGRLAHVSTGAIIDTATRRKLTRVDNTRYFLQVDIVGDEPVRAYSRHGVGYGD